MNTLDRTLSVIDAGTRAVTATLTPGFDNAPAGIAVSPSGSLAYLADATRNVISIVDLQTSGPAREIPLGLRPAGLAIHPGGNALYVARQAGLTVVNLATETLTEVDLGFDAAAVAVSPDGAFVYAVSGDGSTLAVLSAPSNTLAGAPVAFASASAAASVSGASVAPNGRLLYVASSDGTIAAVDTQTRATVSTLTLGPDACARGHFVVDAPPVTRALSVTTPQNTAVPVALAATDTDNDSLTFTVTAGPGHGTLSGTAPALTYTPAPGFAGTDSFAFVASDGALDSSASGVSVTVPFSTSTALSSSASSSTYGQPITLSATVTAGGATPTGSVEFFDGSASLGTTSLSAGRSALTTTAVGGGTRSLTAVYRPGSAAFSGSTSGALTETVAKASGTATLAISVLTPQAQRPRNVPRIFHAGLGRRTGTGDGHLQSRHAGDGRRRTDRGRRRRLSVSMERTDDRGGAVLPGRDAADETRLPSGHRRV